MSGGLAGISLPHATLDALLPMHVIVGADGAISHAAPTFRKVCPVAEPVGVALLDMLVIERPLKLVAASEVGQLAGAKLRLRFRGRTATSLKGVVTPLASGGGYIVNLSFGISVVSAVAEHELTAADFAPSDLTVEMLYLAEANAAAMSEADRLIRRLELSRDAAHHASLTDGLTGLGNRRAMDTWLGARLRAKRAFALMQIDLDYFKAVNDTHGHGAGDAVLEATARRLKAMLRGSDHLARVGGDEFSALVDGEIGEDMLTALSARIIRSIEAPVGVGEVECRISASIGIAIARGDDGVTLERLLMEADKALYDAKRTGRGRAALRAG